MQQNLDNLPYGYSIIGRQEESATGGDRCQRDGSYSSLVWAYGRSHKWTHYPVWGSRCERREKFHL